MTTDTVKQRRILYVEDDPALRLSTSDLLDDMGHHVTEAPDAPTALEWLRAGHPVDILLTDLRMPLMDGQELATAARVLRPGLAVIFTTGASDKTVNEILRDSRTTCLLKPFGIKDLENLLCTLD
jgi:CheY-like chemotaxis protein